eukprot:2366374-Amphidinium_carterae.1
MSAVASQVSLSCIRRWPAMVTWHGVPAPVARLAESSRAPRMCRLSAAHPKSWQQAEAATLEQGISTWAVMLSVDMSKSGVGRLVLQDRAAGRDTTLAGCLRECLAGKAPST